MKKVLFALIILSALLLSCGRIENNASGYVVTLADGTEKSLDYPYCTSFANEFIYASSRSLFVKCGHWSSNSEWTAVFVKEYEAQVISFEEK